MIFPPSSKYRPYPPIAIPDRQWPNRTLTAAPIWCSVDLRDGNQALAVPMNVSQKLELFDALVKCGFKEIEVGFPSASNTEFAFNRRLVEEGRIPDDVTIQVLVQAREDLIEKTVQSLIGAKKAIIHLYNSTSPAQRRVVFGKTKEEIVQIAVQGARWVKERLPRLAGTDVRLQYSPESFSATEVEFAKEISEAVMDVWQPTPERPMILNLPDTVEVAMPNVYADQIEWICRNIKNRDSLIVSLHTHNDRGTGVAATELGLLAGAQRVEGTLFGNGERTGNLDIVNVALNFYMHGIDPKLDFRDMNELIEIYERCTGMTVPPRQPYAGELVFTAFSGSHQDAIKKGLSEWERTGRSYWDVPYLTIDPRDIGREYHEVIRVNSQSGKGGVAYLLESEFGIDLPKEMQREFGPLANDEVDSIGRNVSAKEIYEIFQTEYAKRNSPWRISQFKTRRDGNDVLCDAQVRYYANHLRVQGKGNGPIAAFVHAMNAAKLANFEVLDFREQALGTGEEATALAFIELRLSDGRKIWGAGMDTDSELASIHAILSALNRSISFGAKINARFDLGIPALMQRQFDRLIVRDVGKRKREPEAKELYTKFQKTFCTASAPWRLTNLKKEQIDKRTISCVARLNFGGKNLTARGEGDGVLSAFIEALTHAGAPKFNVANVRHHGFPSQKKAIAYTQIRLLDEEGRSTGKTKWGVGVDINIESASIKAVLSAINRAAGKSKVAA